MSKKGNNNNSKKRHGLTSASESIGAESETIDDTTVSIVLETLFIGALSDWADHNRDYIIEKLRASPELHDVLSNALIDEEMESEEPVKKKVHFNPPFFSLKK